MHHALSTLARVVGRVAVLGVAGCSLIFNPNNIPNGDSGGLFKDAHPDAELIRDANPVDLELDTVEPAAILEGTGDGGGRPEVLVIHGHQMVPGSTVTIGVSGAGSAMIDVLDNGSASVAADGNTLAVRVVAHVDSTLAGGTSLPLVVMVTQPAGSAMVSKPIAWSETGLDELIVGSGSAVLAGSATYSIVSITGTATVVPMGTAPIIIHSASSLTIAPPVDVSGNGVTGGVNGPNGGAKTAPGGGNGAGGAGTTTSGGGGGGFGTAGTAGAVSGTGPAGTAGAVTGDPLVTNYALNQSSGGGGGDVAGGGGGGTIELTAAGTLTVNRVTSNGGAGTAGPTNLSGVSGGGGGAGGVIILRGASATFSAVSVTGGPAGPAGGNSLLGFGGVGGTGGDGRIRVDGSTVSGALGADGHQGAIIDTATPSLFTMATPSIQVDGDGSDIFILHVLDGSGSPIGGIDQFMYTVGSAGNVMASPVLPNAGAYQLCVTPVAGDPKTLDESSNCIHVALIPPM